MPPSLSPLQALVSRGHIVLSEVVFFRLTQAPNHSATVDDEVTLASHGSSY